MIKAVIFGCLMAAPALAQGPSDSAQMIGMLDDFCLPHVQGAAGLTTDLRLAGPGVTDSLLDGAAGRAWVGDNPALALFDYDGATSCGVFGLGIEADVFLAAAQDFALGAGMVPAAADQGRAEYLMARADGDVTLLIAMTVPQQGVAALNAMRLPAGDWSNTVLGEN